MTPYAGSFASSGSGRLVVAGAPAVFRGVIQLQADNRVYRRFVARVHGQVKISGAALFGGSHLPW